MSRYLILNADDFGMCDSYNQAIFQLLEENRISSSTLMAPAPSFDAAAAWCRERGVQNVGLHLTFTGEWPPRRWAPLTSAASLRDESGLMPPDCQSFAAKALSEDVVAEMEAQYQKMKNAGVYISHIDNHMGSLYGFFAPRGYLDLALDFCRAKGLPFRLFKENFYNNGERQPLPASYGALKAYAKEQGVEMPDNLHAYTFEPVEGETYDSFKKSVIALLYGMPEGVNELYIHPTLDTEEVRHITPYWEKRTWEYRLAMDDDFAYALKDADMPLVRYGDIQKLSGWKMHR